MAFVFFLLSIAAGYAAFKRKSPLGFAGAGALLAFWYEFLAADSLIENFGYILIYRWLSLALCAAIGYVGLTLYLKKKGQLPQRKRSIFGESDDVMADMQLLVGRVLDTRSNRTVFSDTHVTQNAFGNLDTYTTHDVQISHNTWLHDINNDVDVTYSGNGDLQARPGHIFGTMSWKGRSFLDVNYSTNKKFTLQGGKAHPLASLVWGVLLVVFGWVMFPLGAVMSPLVWAGWIGWNGGGGMWSKHIVPGSHKSEALLTYGGCLIYLLGVMYVASHRGAGDSFVTALGVGCVALSALHYYVTSKIAQSQHELLVRGEAELDRLYTAGMARQKARAEAAAAVS
ncbi:MAG: hypothetical protein ACN6QH_00725 [Pseudomonas sp.]|uniref:hypothetical protein n=1 Tax=Pseudomonas sp. TaxID=306 RepID=UPI003D10964B